MLIPEFQKIGCFYLVPAKKSLKQYGNGIKEA
jgi:hypothetical protein